MLILVWVLLAALSLILIYLIDWAGNVAINLVNEREQYRLEAVKLREAIRKHMGERGHDRCWLDDLELYSVLDPKFDKMNLQLPPLPEFIHNCQLFWAERQPEPKP